MATLQNFDAEIEKTKQVVDDMRSKHRAIGRRSGQVRQGRPGDRRRRFRYRERPHPGCAQTAEGDGRQYRRPDHRAGGRDQCVRHRIREHEILFRLREIDRAVLQAADAAHAHRPGAQHVACRQSAGAAGQVRHHRRHPDRAEADPRPALRDVRGEPGSGDRAPQDHDGQPGSDAEAHRGTEPAAARHGKPDRRVDQPEGPHRAGRRALEAGDRI